MVNDSKQSSISGGQGALLRSGLTLVLPPKEEEVSFWVGGGNPHRTAVVNPHYHRIQEGFYHADCHPLHTLPGHIHLGHSHVALKVFIPSDGAELFALCWCERQLSYLRRSHKPSNTPKHLQTHFWSLPPKTESSPSGHPPEHDQSIYNPTALSLLCFLHPQWINVAVCFCS